MPFPILALLESMRPHQWVKNGLVFAPLLFAHRLGDSGSVLRAALAFGVFCALSSTIYLVNDLLDRAADREHPTKCKRPIASGRLPPGFAMLGAAGLAACALAGTWWLSADAALGAADTAPGSGPEPVRAANPSDIPFFVWPLAYATLNLGYSLWLKHKVIVDCLCIAMGFQFRVLGGAAAIQVESSRWILLCTFFFALFLAFCKRREELSRSGGSASTRATMEHYTLPFLDQLIAPLAALSILAYALYTVDAETVAQHGSKNLMFTVPFVVFGVFRYLFLIHTRGGGEDPAKLLFRDLPIAIAGLLWFATVLITMATP